jgi:hypothetical protein
MDHGPTRFWRARSDNQLEASRNGTRVKRRPCCVERRANGSLRSLLATFADAFADAIGGANEQIWYSSIRGRFIPQFKRICTNRGFYEHKTYDRFCPRALGGRFLLEQGYQSAGG